MENEEKRPVVFRWEKWETYTNPSLFFLFQNGKISLEKLDEKMESSGYNDYLRKEIIDRITRHEPVLNLLNFKEMISADRDTSVDYFLGDKYIYTIPTPWRLTSSYVKDDNMPFLRRVKLPNGGLLEIEDKKYNTMQMYHSEDNKENCFTTKVTLYENTQPSSKPGNLLPSGEAKTSDNVDIISIEELATEGDSEEEDFSNLEQDIYISYDVDAFNEPINLEISYNGVYLYLSHSSAAFSYSSGCRKRSLSFVSYSKYYSDFTKAEYMEEIDMFGDVDHMLTGIVQVDSDDYPREFSFRGGFGKYRDAITISPVWGSFYAQAIVTHERSKELTDFVFGRLYKRLPGLQQFILDRFPSMMELINGEKIPSIKIDKTFKEIERPLFALNRNGFAFINPPEIEEMRAYFDYLLENRKRIAWEAKHKGKLEEKAKRKALLQAYKKGELKHISASSE